MTILADQLAGVLADPIIQPWLNPGPERADQLVAWLADAVIRIDALGIPDTLVHGDFHPGNVAIQNERPLLFDWSDAAISHPLIDVVTWGPWIGSDTEQADALWTMFLEAWADVVPLARSEPLRAMTRSG